MVGVFAAISRELGIALRFPGAVGHLKDACDARLLAKAVHWAGQAPAAANEIFNISNGDCFLFEQVFPRISEVFSMPCGAPHPMSLARVMGDKSTVWGDIVRKHQLRPYRLRDLVHHGNTPTSRSAIGRRRFKSLLSTIKARKAGFHECVDSEEMFVTQLHGLQNDAFCPADRNPKISLCTANRPY